MTPAKDERVESTLFPDGTNFDNSNRQLLLEEYKIFVETSETVVARRQAANSFFLSVNSALLAALGVLSQTSLATAVSRLAFLAIGAAGTLLCVEWRVLIRSYRQLNTGKFLVIHLLERQLPASLFQAEWIALGEGKDPKKYKPVTSVERIIPILLILLFVVIVVARLSLP